MEGKTCLVTGASDGIGYVAARELASRGRQRDCGGTQRRQDPRRGDAHYRRNEKRRHQLLCSGLVFAGRRSERLAEQVRERTSRLDVLLNNAGAIFLSRRTSIDGLEMTFALNHMGYFLLTNQLLDLLQDSAPARIVNVSSSSHGSPGKFQLEDLPNVRSNRGYRAYGRSKLCNILFTYELSRRLEGSGITVNALHPGLVRTNIARNNGVLGRVVNFFIGARGVDTVQGARTLVYLATSPEVEEITGKYFVDCRPVQSSALSYDPKLAERLWELSERLTRLSEGVSQYEKERLSFTAKDSSYRATCTRPTAWPPASSAERCCCVTATPASRTCTCPTTPACSTRRATW